MEDYKIDLRYIVKVKDLMSILQKPTKKLIDNDGTILPLITIQTELWDYVRFR